VRIKKKNEERITELMRTVACARSSARK